MDPVKRIDWNDLFNHKINFYQEEEMKKELTETFKEMNLSLSMSKFYIKNNKVISHPTGNYTDCKPIQIAFQIFKRNKS